MKQGVDYNLTDRFGHDLFSPVNVRCEGCQAPPGQMCMSKCEHKHDRTLFSDEVLEWMKLYFPWSSDNEAAGIAGATVISHDDLILWGQHACLATHSKNELRSHYRRMRERAIHKQRISSMRALHQWDELRLKQKLKGTT